MKADDNRDQAIERLLRRSLEADGQAAQSADCLDAETLAAWTDGSLDALALAMVEAHVAGCARCQSMAAAMVRTTTAAPVAVPWWRRTMRPAWLVPLTAGAAAVAIWAVVPTQPTVPVQAPPVAGTLAQEAKAEAPPVPSLPAIAEQKEARAGTRAEPPAEKAKRADNEARQQRSSPAPASTDTLADARPLPSAPAAPVAAPPPAAASPAIAGAAPARPDAVAEGAPRARDAAGNLMKAEGFSHVVLSPDPAIRWRLGGRGSIERSEDGGTTWTSLQTGVTVDLIAGVSPEPAVCWVVGRNGTVLRSTDGRTWVAVNIPEAVDLVSVQATDASAATVTATDGRRFQTADGGHTWIQ